MTELRAHLRIALRGLGILHALMLVSLRVAQATPFVLSVADSAGTVGEQTDVAIGSDGRTHIIYYDGSNGDLRYATIEHGAWVTELVDATNLTGLGASIAIDGVGRPHVSYVDSTVRSLKYAVRTDVGWMLQTVVGSGVGAKTDLTLDHAGQPRIVYLNSSYAGLKYIALSNGSWSTSETIAATASRAFASGIADDVVRVVYYDTGIAELRFSGRVAGSWSSETATSEAGNWPSLFIDRGGNPHVSYYLSGDIKFVQRANGVWTSPVVVESGASVTGTANAVAVDDLGRPMVAFRDSTNGDLRFAVRDAGSWISELVFGTGNVGYSCAMALDGHGNPSIAYYDSTETSVVLARSSIQLVTPNGGEVWTAGSSQTIRWSGKEPVDVYWSSDGGATYSLVGASIEGGELRIVVPTTPSLHAQVRVERSVPFSSAHSGGDFIVLRGSGGLWWHGPTDLSAGAGFNPSLALDVGGHPRVSYYTSRLNYAQRVGGSWRTEIANNPGVGGTYSSLVLTEGGEPRIVYYNATAKDLRFAWKSAGVWSDTLVDGSGGIHVGRYCSFGIDGSGKAHISYYDETNQKLKYATRLGVTGAWSFETPDPASSVGKNTSLAVDQFGVVHVSYYDAGKTALRYAVRRAGTWAPELIDVAGRAGTRSSIAVDAMGIPYIAYWDDSLGVLKYASRAGGTWKTESVFHTYEIDGIVQDVALRVQNDGTPLIAYTGYLGLSVATRAGSAWHSEVVDDDAGAAISTPSLALDQDGNGRIAYFDYQSVRLRYASAAVEVTSPATGSTWASGGRRVITWEGLGMVDILLSSDGGLSYGLLASNATGGAYRLTVPNQLSNASKIRIVRALPYSATLSDSLFTIQALGASASLFITGVEDGPGAWIRWMTNCGVDDVSELRVERQRGEGQWGRIGAVHGTSEIFDPDAESGDRYRLIGVNFLGREIALAEESVPSQLESHVWPVPLRHGALTIQFRRAPDCPTEVQVYDVAGRKVSSIGKVALGAGVAEVRWDGKAATGLPARSGLYFVRIVKGHRQESLKVIKL